VNDYTVTLVTAEGSDDEERRSWTFESFDGAMQHIRDLPYHADPETWVDKQALALGEEVKVFWDGEHAVSCYLRRAPSD